MWLINIHIANKWIDIVDLIKKIAEDSDWKVYDDLNLFHKHRIEGKI